MANVRELSVSWTVFLEVKNKLQCQCYYVEQTKAGDTIYDLLIASVRYIYNCHIEGAEADEFESTCKAACEQVTSLDDALARTHLAQNSQGAQLVEVSPRLGSFGSVSFTVGTLNWAKKRTWYQNFDQWTDLGLTDSGDHLTYTSGKTFWINIDSSHLVLQEYYSGTPGVHVGPWARAGGLTTKSSWRPVIKVNGTPQTSGYTINYDAGTVTFGSALQPSDVVIATFRTPKASGGSEFVLKPPDGKLWVVSHSEAQVTADMVIQAPLIYELWRDPDQNYSNADLRLYQCFYPGPIAMYTTSTVGVNVCPPFGGAGFYGAAAWNGWSTVEPQGIANNLIEIPWDMGNPTSHGQPLKLVGSEGDSLRIYLLGDLPFVAESMNVTIYVDEFNEM